MKIKTEDEIVRRVIKMLDERSQVGLDKYKVTLKDDQRTNRNWVQMAQEEALDLANYLEKLKELEGDSYLDGHQAGFVDGIEWVLGYMHLDKQTVVTIAEGKAEEIKDELKYNG